MFSNVYAGKKVLVTGHTGFKGSWLSFWLLDLGAKVVGFSNDVPTQPSIYKDANLASKIKDYRGDIRDIDSIKNIIQKEKPDFIFHLAAQPIVSESYANPVETITTNAIGTMNLLEALRKVDWFCSVVIITSDKSYDNLEWVWGYKETDSLGGKDIYSGSKGAAELIIKSYYHSFFEDKIDNVRIGVARAGNVIGGGDWAKDRIVVDCIKAWYADQTVEIRCPDATRPWQHVLEPLSGYLVLGEALSTSNILCGEAFNFGPRAEQNRTVVELLSDLFEHSNIKIKKDPFKVTDNIPFKESGLLKLNCDKALFHLKWEANLDYLRTVQFTADWYSKYHVDIKKIDSFTIKQIREYAQMAKNKGYKWAV
jgi:CDP-glucose 4,6-dehydratase